MRSRNRGLSLIEVLIALVVLAISLLALVPLFGMSAKSNASSGQLAIANTLAREKLEELITYPTTDARLSIPSGGTIAASAAVCGGAGAPSGCVVNTECENDLPLWYEPVSGATSFATARPAANWFPFPCTRTYTVQAYFVTNLATPLTSLQTVETDFDAHPDLRYYDVKLVTVTVQPAQGPLPGLRRTTQSAYVRFRWRP